MERALRIVTVLLLAAAVWLLWLLVVSSDRARAAAVRLSDRLQTLPTRLGTGTPADGDFANADHFPSGTPAGGQLNSVITADPPGLNPLLFNDAVGQNIFEMCSMTLADRDWEHPEKFRMMLAESITVSPDHRQYHVKLRRGAFWQSFTDPETGVRHPAKEVTAYDIKFTVDAILDPAVNCAAIRGYYQDIEEVRIINDFEFVVVWSREYYGSRASTMGLFPLPRHFYAPDGKFDGRKFNDDHKRNRMIVGCGPYLLSAWESSRSVRLEKNPDYLGARYGAAPPLDTRKIDVIKLPNTQFQSLLAGKTGMLSLTPEQWAKRTGSAAFNGGKFRKIRFPGSSYSYIGYNEKVPCFADAKTRRALTMLIDREEILDKLMYGCGRVAKGPFKPGSPFSDPALAPLPYDPEQAKRLLREAGWRDSDGDGILERDGRKFSFTMLQISGSSIQMRMLPMIKNYFAAAGIDMKLQTVEWSVLLERLKKREFEACNLGWTGTVEPDLFQVFHSSQIAGDGDNFISFSNKALDEKIMALRKEFDMAKRLRLYREMEKIIHEEQPYTFMFYPDSLLVVSTEYDNVRVFPDGVYPLSFRMKPEAMK